MSLLSTVRLDSNRFARAYPRLALAATAGIACLLALAPSAATAGTAGGRPASAEAGPASRERAPAPSDPMGTRVGAPSRSKVRPPSLKHGATTAAIAVATEARGRPGGGRRVWRVGTQTMWSGEPQVLLVLRAAYRRGREWLRVRLPIRPDGASGWIPRNNVVLHRTRYWIRVNGHARVVTVFRDGRRLRRFRAVVGKPSTPTPDGLAAIYEIDLQPDPTAFLGPWAMPLTALSKALHSFEGGPGRIAIHGRDGASLLDPLGSALSHGCVRIDNGPITWLAHHVPQGTPVQIFGTPGG